MQCYSHWHMTLDPGLIKRRFTDSEDQIVLGLVTKAGGVGNIKWSVIATHLPRRNTKKEDASIIQFVETMGWSAIAKEMGRSPDTITNRWNNHLKPRKKKRVRK